MAEHATNAAPKPAGSPSARRDVLAEIDGIQALVAAGDTDPLLTDVGPFLPTGQTDARRWIVVLAVALLGCVAFAIASPDGLRAGASYLAGLCVAIAAFEFGAFNIKMVDRVAPQFTLAAAMFSYLLTAVGFALILAASSPRVVDGTGVAVGLGVGLTVWLGALVLASRVRLEQP